MRRPSLAQGLFELLPLAPPARGVTIGLRVRCRSGLLDLRNGSFMARLDLFERRRASGHGAIPARRFLPPLGRLLTLAPLALLLEGNCGGALLLAVGSLRPNGLSPRASGLGLI